VRLLLFIVGRREQSAGPHRLEKYYRHHQNKAKTLIRYREAIKRHNLNAQQRWRISWHQIRINSHMKKIYLVIMALSIVLSSCYTAGTAGKSGKVPPGQVKKATGSKSAKPYAPGQRKKNAFTPILKTDFSAYL